MFRYGSVVSVTKSSTAAAGPVGHPRHVGDQDPAEDQDDVDEEERVDVVGDVVAGDRRSGVIMRPAIRSSEASTAAAKASRGALAVERLEPGLGAAAGRGDRPAIAAGSCVAEQLGGAGGGLGDQLARRARGRAGLGAGLGQRLGDEREVGGRAAHHRGRGIQSVVGELDHAGRARSSALARSRRSPRRRRRSPRGRPRPRGSASSAGPRRRGAPRAGARPAPRASTETTRCAAASDGATASSFAGFTARTTKSARAASSSLPSASPPSSSASAAARPEPESVNSIVVAAAGPAAGHRGGHVSRTDEADDHARQPRWATPRPESWSGRPRTG